MAILDVNILDIVFAYFWAMLWNFVVLNVEFYVDKFVIKFCMGIFKVEVIFGGGVGKGQFSIKSRLIIVT
jgi:hypothetical protein